LKPFALAPPLQQVDRTYVLHRGRKLSYFGGCDYFRLSSHPKVHAAVCDALEKYGLNVAASRVTTGNHALYEELEGQLCSFFGAEAAVLVASGYAANFAVAEALTGQFSHALIDEQSHSSLKSALQILDAKVISFAHCDPEDMRKCLRGLSKTGRVLVATDGMFAYNGDIAPLNAYLEILPRNGILLVDDAHAAGTLGRISRNDPRLVRTITLSKAFGVFGGAILGSKRIRDQIVARSGFFIGQTPLPLPLAAAALTTLRLLRTDSSLHRRLRDNTTFVKSRLRALGFDVPDNPSPVVSFVPKRASEIARFSRLLLARGIFPSWIRYPGGPKHGYFRFALSSEHSRTQLEALLDAFMRLLPGLAVRKNRQRAGAG
jgi:7-keto-8-aminopelargonate synthetase-like enzyme